MEETQLNNYKVLIRCSTYNHSDYIKETLNGFVTQKTNFPFLCLIMDDASTDGEQLLIKKFIEDECDPNRTKIISNDDIAEVVMAHHRANPNCVLLAYLLKINLYGTGKKEPLIKPWQNQCKYIAQCEGDDYWIDPLKLQKQVDFLDANPEYGMCHTGFVSVPKNIKSSLVPSNDTDDYFYEILCSPRYRIGTLTTMIRVDVYNNIPMYYLGQKFKMGDLPMWIEIAKCSKIKYIKDTTAAYRVLESSASHNPDIQKMLAFYQSAVDCRIFYAEKYGIELPAQAKSISHNALKLAFEHSNKELAKEFYKKAKSEGVLDLRLYILYICTIYPIIGKVVKLLHRFIKRT